MKPLLPLLAMLLAASPVLAQSNSITVSLVQPQFSREAAFAEGERIPVGLGSRTGFSLRAAHRFGRTSVGLDVSRMNSPARASFGADAVGVGSLTLTPISANVALHGNGRRFDPYAGAGVAYVMTTNLHSDSLDSMGLGTVSVGNDLTFSVNAGVNIALTPSLALSLDARYMPVDVSVTAADTTRAKLEFRTFTTGAGLRWNF